MSKVIIDDNILKNACGELSAAIIKGYDIENIPVQTYSDGFKKKMEVLFTKNRQNIMFKNLLVRVAIIFLVATVTGSIIFATNVQARSYVIRLIKEITNGYTNITVVNEEDFEQVDVEFGWLPTEIDSIETFPDPNYTTLICSSSSTDDLIFLIYEDANESSMVRVRSDKGKDVVWNGTVATYFEKTETEPECNLYWVDEQHNIFFELVCTYDENTLFKIAENLVFK